MPRILLVSICLSLLGCGSFPDLEQATGQSSKSAEYPVLVPLEPLLAGAEQTNITPQTTAGLNDRVARLRSRAASMARPVIEPGIRARMLAALRRRG